MVLSENQSRIRVKNTRRISTIKSSTATANLCNTILQNTFKFLNILN